MGGREARGRPKEQMSIRMSQVFPLTGGDTTASRGACSLRLITRGAGFFCCSALWRLHADGTACLPACVATSRCDSHCGVTHRRFRLTRFSRQPLH